MKEKDTKKVACGYRMPYPSEVDVMFDDLEHCEGESETIPGQTIPFNEMVLRYQQGLPLPSAGHMYQEYSGSESEVTFDNTEPRLDTDIVDVQSELEYRKARIREANEAVKSPNAKQSQTEEPSEPNKE